MLRIKVHQNHEAGTIHLSQCAYLDSILHRYHLADLKPLSTPMDTQVRLTSKHAPATPAVTLLQAEYGQTLAKGFDY